MGKIYFRLTILLVVVTFSLILGGVWWWALFGMNYRVGNAIGVTAACSVVATVIVTAIWEDKDKEKP